VADSVEVCPIEDVEVIDTFGGSPGPVGREVVKVVGTELEVTFAIGPIPAELVLASAVVQGMGIGVIIVEPARSVLSEGSVGNGTSGVGKVRFAVRETDRLEMSPSRDEGRDGIGRSGNPVTLSTDVAMLSIADVIGGTIGGTKFGNSVALDVSVAVMLMILEVVVISATPVVVSELLPSVPDPKPSSSGMLFAGLMATRGGKVVNCFGRTRSGIGVGETETVVVTLVVSVASSVRSIEVDVAFVSLLSPTALSITARLCSPMSP